MKIIDKSKPVMVTGGSGYLASWIVKMLLESGFDVHTTVRDISKKEKYKHLTEIANSLSGNLKIFEADLLKEGSFTEGMNTCELVIHTASPFFYKGIKDPMKDLIIPAVEGTANVMESIELVKSVKRVVLTSSCASIFGDSKDISATDLGVFTEEHWNETSNVSHQPYSYSKTEAEKEAWKFAETQDRYDLLVINSGFILGSSLTKRTDSTSIETMIQLADGTFKAGAPEIYIGMVDVRDVAKAHINAGIIEQAKGRHILVSENLSFLDIGKLLRKNFQDKKYKFPNKNLPKFLVWLAGPFVGFTRKYVSNNVGIKVKFDNSKSVNELDIDYIPIENTVKDHFQQLIDHKLI